MKQILFILHEEKGDFLEQYTENALQCDLNGSGSGVETDRTKRHSVMKKISTTKETQYFTDGYHFRTKRFINLYVTQHWFIKQNKRKIWNYVWTSISDSSSL